jgi:hypothetical protein
VTQPSRKTIFGAKLTLIAKRSPWRSFYVKEKERLPMKVLVGQSWARFIEDNLRRRAFNRVTTRIVLEIGELARKWAKERIWEPPFRKVDPE